MQNQPTVLITGANRGLGRALVHAFLGEGFAPILHSRREIVGDYLEWREARFVFGDLRDDDTIDRLQEAVGDHLDVLVNNAAIYSGGWFDLMTQAEIAEVVESDLLAPIFLTKALWPALVKAKGTVVNINSLASISPAAGETAYGAAKSGLRGFSEALQYEATPAGVRVLSAILGGLKTDMTRGRAQHDLMIDPAEAAAVITDLCLTKYDSLRITSIEIKRRLYA